MIENKGYVIATVFVLISMVLASSTVFYYVQSEQYKNAYETISGNIIYVNIGINYNNGTIEWYNDTIVQKGTSAFEMTFLIAYNVTYEQYSFGIFITGINNITAEGSNYWALYYNGEYSLIGASDLFPLSSDTILWSYESF